MKIDDRLRRAGHRPLLLSFLVGTTLLTFGVVNGCAGGEVEPPGVEDEENEKKKGGDPERDSGPDPDPEVDAGPNPEVDAGPGATDELRAVIAPIANGNLDTTFTLDGEASENMGGRAIDYAWAVESPNDCGGELEDASAPKTTFTPACRGEHEVTLTVSLLDGSETSTATATFTVDNRRPVLSGLALESAFLPGEDAVISATVTDEDAPDQPTCTARLAGDSEGDPAGLEIPSAPSADCRFVISTPPRVDTWKIEVVANDGFENSLPATIEIKAGNEPPVIDGVSADEDAVGYACVDGACASETVRVTVLASDDTDSIEDLQIALVDVSEDAPAGVTVTATPVAGSPGIFDVVVSREDLGPMAGSYSLEASVTEVTAGEDGPATVTAQVSFDVTNAPPVIGTVTAADVPHAYASGDYTATVTVTATASDPEANALVTSIALVSCPTANAGQAACGGAGLSIEETASAGSLVLELETSSLVNLVGEYTFLVTATDADGAVVTEEATLVVTNTTPTVSPGFQASKEQTYTGSAHSAETPLLHDADGDPITVNLTITCPDGTSITPPSGSCGTGQTVTLNSTTGILRVSGPATGLLGGYAISGTITDGAATGNINRTFTITNTGPSIQRSSTETVTCDHRTSGSTVTNEPGCSFPYAATTSDPNGDPLTYSVTLTNAGGYSRTGVAYTNAAVPANGTISFSSGLQSTWADFKSSFDAQGQRITVIVSDPFGETAESGMNPRLQNRAPVLVSAAFRNRSNTGNPPTLPNDQYETGRARDTYSYFCNHTACGSHTPPYEFALWVDAVDPDGDPVEVSLDLECSNPVVHAGGGAVSAYQPIPANKLFLLEMPGTVTQCSGINWHREWNVHLVSVPLNPCDTSGPFPVCFQLVPRIRCRADAATSRVGDGISSAPFGETVGFETTLANTSTPFTCSG